MSPQKNENIARIHTDEIAKLVILHRKDYTNEMKETRIKRIKEHNGDTCNNRENTSIAKIALTENININYDNTKKLAIFNNRNYTFCREAIEIISNNKTCNIVELFQLIKNGNEYSKRRMER